MHRNDTVPQWQQAEPAWRGSQSHSTGEDGSASVGKSLLGSWGPHPWLFQGGAAGQARHPRQVWSLQSTQECVTTSGRTRCAMPAAGTSAKHGEHQWTLPCAGCPGGTDGTPAARSHGTGQILQGQQGKVARRARYRTPSPGRGPQPLGVLGSPPLAVCTPGHRGTGSEADNFKGA